jgi:hypothetical protein
MTDLADELSGSDERRVPLIGGRVECWRVGLVDVDRCMECDYLLRLEIAGAPPSGSVICAGTHPESEIDFGW